MHYSKDSIVIKNQDLREVISFLKGKNRRFIKSNNPLKILERLNVTYKRKDTLSKKDHRDSIVKELKKAYGFSTKIWDKVISKYKIVVKDSMLFNTYKSLDFKTSTSTISKKELEIKNGNLSVLASLLSALYPKESTFFVRDTNNYRFSLQFKKVPFEELPSLLDKYGLSITKENENQEYLEIVFDE